MRRRPRTNSTGIKQWNWTNLLSARLHAERTQRALRNMAERYAQIDAARDAEIQRLIAEAEETEEQVIPAGRRADITDGPAELHRPA